MMAWRVPTDIEQRNNTTYLKICKDIDDNLTIYHTRAMMNRAKKSWNILKKVDKSAIVSLYKSISQDDSTPDKNILEMILNMVHDGSNSDEV